MLDLRSVNKYLNITKFRYENLSTVVDIIDQDDFFVTFDLKNGYHHIPLAEEHQKYLGFAWEYVKDGKTLTRFFRFPGASLRPSNSFVRLYESDEATN